MLLGGEMCSVSILGGVAFPVENQIGLTSDIHVTCLHVSHVVSLGDKVTAVSARRSMTFWLKTAALTGGKPATRLWNIIISCLTLHS
jgi:hypothetical protein